MSVVVAIVHNNQVFMGSDSQITRGSSRFTLSNPNNYKIWHIDNKNELIMGAVGKVRENNIIKTSTELIEEIDILKQKIDYVFVIRELVPRMMNELEKSKVLTKDTDSIPVFNSSYLIAYKNKLFMISPEGAVLEISDYVAIGSGASEALGNLLATEHLDPEKRIELAIKSSATNDIYVDYPIIITNTENGEFKVIYEGYDKK